MKIQIAARFKPFSHQPGVSCAIPRTCSVLRAYPTLLRIDQHEIPLPLTGPVTNFTVQQDLERDCVYVFGRAIEGYYKLKIQGSDKGFSIRSEKGPIEDKEIKDPIAFNSAAATERLSLGSHKAQDWDLVKRRKDLKEIVPVLIYLAQKLPMIEAEPLVGTLSLLEFPESRTALEKHLLALFDAGFSDLLVPRLFDDQYQGLVLGDSSSEIIGNPFYLLQEAGKLIRSLFFEHNGAELAFLPKLPVSFDAGRMINIAAAGIGNIDFEWSKKTLRRVLIRSTKRVELKLKLQKGIKTFRVNQKERLKSDDVLRLSGNQTYLLDRFER